MGQITHGRITAATLGLALGLNAASLANTGDDAQLAQSIDRAPRSVRTPDIKPADPAPRPAYHGSPIDEPPPMIPLPPALWFGLITTGGIAWQVTHQHGRLRWR